MDTIQAIILAIVEGLTEFFTYFIYCTHGVCSKSYGNGGNRVP